MAEQVSLKDRIRKIDVDKLSNQQADELSAYIGKEMAKYMDEANNKCNQLLKAVGYETVISYSLKKIGQPIEIIEEKKKTKTKGRPRKKQTK